MDGEMSKGMRIALKDNKTAYIIKEYEDKWRERERENILQKVDYKAGFTVYDCFKYRRKSYFSTYFIARCGTNYKRCKSKKVTLSWGRLCSGI
jgi:hypothetical protein